MNYRNLTATEVKIMQSRGCVSEAWSRIEVKNDFNPHHYRNVNFSGLVRLGSTTKTFFRDRNVVYQSGIYDATIHNCVIGDNVYISKVANYIANYEISDDVFIENVTRINATGDSTFGNGVEVSVLNESGGREVPIYDRLSSHVAYLIAMYRHDNRSSQNDSRVCCETAKRKGGNW